MARKRKLSIKEVQALMKQDGLHCVGENLYVQVVNAKLGKVGTSLSWVCRYQLAGARHGMGLGPLSLVTLAEAFEAAHQARKLALAGIDPISERKARRASVRLTEARGITFQECAKEYIETNAPSWKNPQTEKMWRQTLEKYAYPVFGNVPVGSVDTGLLTAMLQKIWLKKNATAIQVRNRVEMILDFAKTREWREGENPARWKGHLDHVLPKYTPRPVHRAALPYTEIGTFMQRLKGDAGTSARALELTILTAVRTGEALGARWNEIDFAKKIWVIPAGRMKSKLGQGQPHRVPLSDAAIAVLRTMEPAKNADSDFVFSARKNRALSQTAMLHVLSRLGCRTDITVHGFRSTFKDWASECTSYPGEVSEAALAHAVPSAVEAAYRRGDLFEKRKAMMNDWAAYVQGRPAQDGDNVVSLRAQA